MYKLTLKDEKYNNVSFLFEDLAELTAFLVIALEHASEETKAEIRKEEEGEEDAV